ncbi:Glycoprotein 3-alpha-L-fucosyltransferase A [Lamellibrachia satsuma]|nr:Glycoprotein 3-alpha-L-fucosyltransferase A [Lamellibrachia satsuma]
MRLHLRRAVFVVLSLFLLLFLAVSLLQKSDVTTLENSPPRHGNSAAHPRRRHPRRSTYHPITRHLDKYGPKVTRTGSYPNLWPHAGRWSIGANFDRIVSQMKFVPRGHNAAAIRRSKYKTIALYDGDDIPMGQRKFITDKCPVDTCLLTSSDFSSADALLFKTGVHTSLQNKPRHQTWILFSLESPLNTGLYEVGLNQVNWTATYRPDSSIVAPYEKFQFFANVSKLPRTAPRNFAAGKRKLVAWFVSNCDTTNGRMDYVQQLQKHIQVDVFGACGKLTCTRDDEDACFNMLKQDYKFYLAFENSNCQYYITEKFFRNALMNDVVPVVMGARREDYAIAAPPRSYIHVDDFNSPQHLAKYLHKLDADHRLYNDYFRWKGTGQFIDTKFWCRVCAMLHGDHVQWYPDVNSWWYHNATCTRGRWDDPSKLMALDGTQLITGD